MFVNLKAFRRDNNLTQGELAAFLECTQSFISQMEHGISPMPPEVIRKILAHGKWDTTSLEGVGISISSSMDGAMENKSDNIEIGTLLSVAVQQQSKLLAQQSEALARHGEELRKQGERLDRILDMVSQREKAAFPCVSQADPSSTSPRVKELIVRNL